MISSHYSNAFIVTFDSLKNKSKDFSSNFCPLPRSGRLFAAPSDERAVFSHDDLLRNGTFSVIGGIT